ncbi:hypothetical protein C0993_010659 [Termitomyces sp. T159_Od127]|nr:hypothetical protein C0993_010659 [Termitomyces sp. T159_Od127]
MQSASSAEQGTTPAMTGISNTEVYSILNTKPDTATSIIQSGSCQQEGDHPTTPHERPATSIADFILDGVTYDKILSSSAKGLRIASQQHQPPTPPFGDDARTPPNSPINALSNHSLMSASLNIMASEIVTRSDIDKAEF